MTRAVVEIKTTVQPGENHRLITPHAAHTTALLHESSLARTMPTDRILPTDAI